MALLEIEDLSVSFEGRAGALRAVEGFDLEVVAGEIVGVVGESGSGKSVAMLAAMGLIAKPGRVSARRLRFDGADLTTLAPAQRRRITGKDMAMVFQEPVSSLDPCYTVGFQIAEALRVHGLAKRRGRRARALELLRQVGIPAPEERLRAYPHQLSGGMAQRVMIAIAIACRPRLLITDEPTTALDVTVQAQIMDLLLELRRRHGMALILISHDISLVAEIAERVVVMYAGQIAEQGPAGALLGAPRHPYTAALLAALPEAKRGPLPAIPGTVPGLEGGMPVSPPLRPRGRALRARDPGAAAPGRRFPALSPSPAGRGGETMTAVMEARNLSRHYPVRQGLLGATATLKALDGVSFRLAAGRTLAVVGESGCGKTTLARQLALVETPTAGTLFIAGEDAAGGSRRLRRKVQMIFQNPFEALNPRRTVAASVAEPLRVNTSLSRAEWAELVAAMMARVGLAPEHRGRYPHMFSGGQRQRIAIARALMLNPAVVVADEPVSALDLSIQAQVLNLMMALRDEFGLAYVFISHDLGVVGHIADTVMVMYLGRAVEQGSARAVLKTPRHPYTRALLAARPGRRRGAAPLAGEPPSPLAPPPRLRLPRPLPPRRRSVPQGPSPTPPPRRPPRRLPPRRKNPLIRHHCRHMTLA